MFLWLETKQKKLSIKFWNDPLDYISYLFPNTVKQYFSVFLSVRMRGMFLLYWFKSPSVTYKRINRFYFIGLRRVLLTFYELYYTQLY